jgi:hypothetical protein
MKPSILNQNVQFMEDLNNFHIFFELIINFLNPYNN